MSTYKIQLPRKLDAIKHPKLLALKGVQIGPAWSLPDPERELGMRGIPSKKTKNANWMKYRIARKKRNKTAYQSRMRNT